ncbi:hypothetical protein [Pediococcus claussenii]|nr:hypothetical protein [Pediococcus claussenii]ANZ68806.1 hypothetical protein AYR57_00050 [Pediococcus claussenii]ANZ70622.1 hypothetical protein AYR58_00050 [Pediococcus claussenii]
MLYLAIILGIAFILLLFRVAMVITNRENPLLTILLTLLVGAGLLYSSLQVPKALKQGDHQSAQVDSTSADSLTNKLPLNQLTDNSSSQSEAKQELSENSILNSVRESYKSIGKVSFDGSTKTYSLLPTASSFVKPLRQIIANPNQANEANFDQMVTNFKTTSKSIENDLGKGYTLQLLNPDKANQKLLAVKDQNVTYNFFSK